jgi:hypothetical protein
MLDKNKLINQWDRRGRIFEDWGMEAQNRTNSTPTRQPKRPQMASQPTAQNMQPPTGQGISNSAAFTASMHTPNKDSYQC